MAPRPLMACSLGVALLAAMGFAAWVAAEAFEPGSGSGGLIAFGALVALGPCVRAGLAAFQLDRGQLGMWRAMAWFVAACLGLVFLMVAAGFTRLGG